MIFLIPVILLAGLLILFLVIWINSPGKTPEFTDNRGNIPAGSISEKCFVNIGDTRQGMFILGRDTANPVMLYIHGGPAFPNYFLFEKYKPGLEEYFTVCYWEQRGGGLSYHPDISPESMNFEQLISDALEVSNYLRDRFGKEKIYLMAHSGGTPFAIQLAARYPQLFHAYIGMAQITRQSESERIAFKFMTDEYRAKGNTKALSELEKFHLLDNDTSFTAFYKSLIRDKSMHELGIGTMHEMRSVFSGVFVPVWMCNAYTLKEKFNIWKAKFGLLKKAGFVEELFLLDIPALVPKLEIPVYFFSGKYDLTVNRDLTKSYLEKLEAPVKGFYSFDESAHSPLFEEPVKCVDIIVRDVLNAKSDLADE